MIDPESATKAIKPMRFSPNTIKVSKPSRSARLLAAHDNALSRRLMTLTSISIRMPVYQRMRCVASSNTAIDEAHKMIEAILAPT